MGEAEVGRAGGALVFGGIALLFIVFLILVTVKEFMGKDE